MGKLPTLLHCRRHIVETMGVKGRKVQVLQEGVVFSAAL